MKDFKFDITNKNKEKSKKIFNDPPFKIFENNISKLHTNYSKPNLNLSLEDRLKKCGIKSGTTIIGLKYGEGIILASDTQTTAIGGDVAYAYSLESKKIYIISKNLALAGTGLVAEINLVKDFLINFREYYEDRYEENFGVEKAAQILYLISPYLWFSGYILGGKTSNSKNSLIYDISGFFYKESVNYIAQGSGALFGHAQGILDGDFKPELKKEQAIALVLKALKIAKQRDVFSGGDQQIILIENSSNKIKELSKEEIKKYLKENEKSN